MGERDNPISIRSKRRITDALLELMKTTPFSKITIKDIVDKAGLTRQTFYHNFETKEDVLLYKEDELVKGFIKYLAVNRIFDWEDIICCFFRYWQEHADFMNILLQNNLVHLLSMRIPDYFSAIQMAHFAGTDLTETEARMWYSYVSGAVVGLLTTWLPNPGGLSARELSKMVVSMMDGTMMERSKMESSSGGKRILEFMSSVASK